MKKLNSTLGFLALIAIAFLAAQPANAEGQAQLEQTGDGQDLVIRDVTVISPERAAPLEHAYVLIRNGRIAGVSGEPVSGEREIDGSGRFLVPGLIDSHVHLGEVPGMRYDQQQAHPEIAEAAREQEPRSYLYFGFTTVVDLFGNAVRAARWNKLDIRPDARFCGGAPLANAYPMMFAPGHVRFESMPYFLYDERQREQIPSGIDPAEHTPEAVVARMAADGAICVKTTYETGFGNLRDLPIPTLEMIRDLVSAADAKDMPVLIHANSKEAQEFALAAGVDIIAHGLWNGVAADDGALSEGARLLLGAIADRGVGYQPTLQVLRGEVDLFDDAFLGKALLSHAVPAPLIEWYGTRDGQWFREEIAGNLGGQDAELAYAPMLARLDRAVRILADSDARLLFGSDTPSAPTYANPPGLNGRLEMQRWISAGVTEEALFKAMTLENARAFGLQDELGSIEPNKLAHLLLLTENPLESVAAYDTIETVILAGRPIERAELSARRR